MNRLEWILGIVLVLLLLLAAGLAAALWLKPETAATPAHENELIASYADDVAAMPQVSGQTAQHAFVIAQPKAQEWQSDAVLVSASATWPQGAKPEFIENGIADWGFTFHSPSNQSNAMVTLINGEPIVIQGEAIQSVNLLESTSWQLDSQDVLAKFFLEGGRTFMELEDINIVSMTYSANDPNNNGRLEWLISAYATQTGHSYSMRVDASSGEILEIIHESS